jgi:hypothetical protein
MQNAWEIKHFHAHVKENYIVKGKGRFYHQDLYSIIMKDKILLVFPNAETILRLFLSPMVTNCS